MTKYTTSLFFFLALFPFSLKASDNDSDDDVVDPGENRSEVNTPNNDDSSKEIISNEETDGQTKKTAIEGKNQSLKNIVQSVNPVWITFLGLLGGYCIAKMLQESEGDTPQEKQPKKSKKKKSKKPKENGTKK